MNAVTLKVIMIGIPILTLVLGIIFIVLLVVSGIREAKLAKTTVSGLLYIHPDKGGGYKLIDKDKTITRPTLRPIWYKAHWYSREIPFWFFYEKKEEGIVATEAEPLKCKCGYEAENNRQLNAHMMWTPKRKIAKEEWSTLHAKIETEKNPEPLAAVAYKTVPYNIDDNKGREDVVISPFGVYDINNWDCQKRFLTSRKSNWEKGLQMGAGVIMAIACLIGIIALGGELGKNNTAPASASPPPITQTIGGR